MKIHKWKDIKMRQKIVPNEAKCPKCNKSNREGNCSCYSSGEFYDLQKKLQQADLEVIKLKEELALSKMDHLTTLGELYQSDDYNAMAIVWWRYFAFMWAVIGKSAEIHHLALKIVEKAIEPPA